MTLYKTSPPFLRFDRESNVDGKKQNQKAQCIYSSLKRRRFHSRISSRETNEICFRPSRDSLRPQCRTISPQLFHHGEESALEPAVLLQVKAGECGHLCEREEEPSPHHREHFANDRSVDKVVEQHVDKREVPRFHGQS